MEPRSDSPSSVLVLGVVFLRHAAAFLTGAAAARAAEAPARRADIKQKRRKETRNNFSPHVSGKEGTGFVCFRLDAVEGAVAFTHVPRTVLLTQQKKSLNHFLLL